jgi:hypothetical protein
VILAVTTAAIPSRSSQSLHNVSVDDWVKCLLFEEVSPLASVANLGSPAQSIDRTPNMIFKAVFAFN